MRAGIPYSPRAVLGLALAALTACALAHETTPAKLPLRDFPAGNSWQVDILIRLPEPASVQVVQTEPWHCKASLVRNGKSEAIVLGDSDGIFSARSYAILTSGKKEQLLLVGEDGGSGYAWTTLALFNPLTMSFVQLTFGGSFSPIYPEHETSLSDNAADKRNAAEVAQLQQLKYAFGFQDGEMLKARSADPDLCWYFWRLDNYPLSNQPLKAREYRGQPTCQASAIARLVDGDMTYTAYFKAGVLAYDSCRPRLE